MTTAFPLAIQNPPPDVFEDEHHGHSQPETTLEMFLRLHWLLLGVVAAVGAGGNVEWARGALGALGLLSPIIITAYYYSPERPAQRIVKPYILWLIPWWVMLVIYLAGSQFPAFQAIDVVQGRVWELAPLPLAWLPVLGRPLEAAIAILFFAGLYASGVNALLIPNARLVFARTWTILIFDAGILAGFGVVQSLTHAKNMFWSIPTANRIFFSTFPHHAQWCAFAILWMGMALGMVAWLVRQRGWKWLAPDGWSLFVMTVVLAWSIWLAGNPFHKLLGALVAAVGSFVLAWQTYKQRQDRSRQGPAASICLASGVVFLLVAVIVTLGHGSTPWITYGSDTPGHPAHQFIVKDALLLWRQRPWFGWGQTSYGVVNTLLQQADQNGVFSLTPRSDLLQSLVENGVVGTFAWCLPAAAVLLRIMRERRLASFLIAPLAGVAAIAVLAIVDFPFSSPAVFFGFWFCLFSLCRWSELDDEHGKSSFSDRRRVEIQRAQDKTTIHQGKVA